MQINDRNVSIMSATRSVLIIIIGITVILAAGCTQPAAQQQPVPATPAAPTEFVLTMINPVAPVPVASTDGVNIAYELELNTSKDMKFVPEKIEVIDPATQKILFTPDADVLARSFKPAADPPLTAEELMKGSLKVPTPRISIWFKIRPDTVPDKLVHRLTLNRTAGGLPPVTITGGEVTVRKDVKPVVIGSPMRGPGWAVMETTSGTTHHFLMPVTMYNRTTVDQRYAQDWFYVDPVTGHASNGNVTLASDFYGYGKELLAVADGTVVDTRDGVPDNPNYKLPPFAFETGTGNNVVIDIGNNKYAVYCHIIPGSIRVKKGDKVKEGDVIGLLGNSGQSEIPHLHFEVVTDHPAIMGSEGYPFVFRSFDLIAGMNATLLDERTSRPDYTSQQYWKDFGDFVNFFKTPVPQQNKLQENYAIVRFP
jgi:murein DD-endopeptidase MepM/ murein hydrolase activator NlpD